LHELDARTPRLSPADEERAAALTDTGVRAEWRAAHIALRLLIERAAGAGWRRQPFLREARGKPRLEGASVVFSLAHTPGLALIGLAAEGSIGVDIERARALRIGAARRAHIVAAATALADAPLPAEEEARLLQSWVRLEAFAKADACGIGRLLTRLGILGTQGGGDAAGERASALRTAHAPAGVLDLDLGPGIHAAATLFAAPAPGAVSWLPLDIQALEKLAN
jgi:4'-phosphopantetheinyl transferase